jgi:hypothetical protein
MELRGIKSNAHLADHHVLKMISLVSWMELYTTILNELSSC